MSVKATVICGWVGEKPSDAQDQPYMFVPFEAQDRETALRRGERMLKAYGAGFAISVEDGDHTTARLCETGEEMDWDAFLARYGVQVGLTKAQ